MQLATWPPEEWVDRDVSLFDETLHATLNDKKYKSGGTLNLQEAKNELNTIWQNLSRCSDDKKLYPDKLGFVLGRILLLLQTLGKPQNFVLVKINTDICHEVKSDNIPIVKTLKTIGFNGIFFVEEIVKLVDEVDSKKQHRQLLELADAFIEVFN